MALVAIGILLAVLSGLLDSDSDSSSSGDSGGSGEDTTQPVEQASSYTCWDGSTSTSYDDCTVPEGDDALRWMFPSLSTDDCTQETSDDEGGRTAWRCPFPDGQEGYVRYSLWNEQDAIFDHYENDIPSGHAAWRIDGREIGYRWRTQTERDDGKYPYKAARSYSELPFSFSVYATSQELIDYALDDLIQTRPPWEERGAPEG